MLNPDKSNDPGIGAFIRENGKPAQHGACGGSKGKGFILNPA